MKSRVVFDGLDIPCYKEWNSGMDAREGEKK